MLWILRTQKNRPVQSIYDIAHRGIIVPELFIVELIHYAWHAHKRQLLNSLAAEVDALVDFGLFLVGPLAENKINLLGRFIDNYGIIILILTILIKLVLFPLTYKQYKSTGMMSALKPEIDKLNEKYPKQEDAMKKQQAMMDLYKRAGVNPMGGCLPVLLQMPLLIAMFRFFPASIELRHESFLWVDDLSTYDAILNLPFSIPWYGDHVSLFCLLMTIVNILYIKMSGQANAGGQQMPGMKMMLYLTPIMMLFWFNDYAAALSYYYFLTLLITIVQTYVIKRTINPEEVLNRLKTAKVQKTPTKSRFQQRLEEAAKKRGVKLPK